MTENVKIVIKHRTNVIAQVAYCNVCGEEAMPPYCEARTGCEGGGIAITTTFEIGGTSQSVEAVVCGITHYNSYSLALRDALQHWGLIACD